MTNKNLNYFLINFNKNTMNTDIKEVINLIKYTKKQTQKDIAETIGVRSTYLSDVISGRVPYSDSLKGKFSEHYSDVLNEPELPSYGSHTTNAHKKHDDRPHFSDSIKALSRMIEEKDCKLKEKDLLLEEANERITTYLSLLSHRDDQISQLINIINTMQSSQ